MTYILLRSLLPANFHPVGAMTHPLINPLPSKHQTDIRCQRGMTLVELSLVTAILLGLIGTLFVGVSAYKRGANRANCIQNIANLQKAMRSYCNLNEIFPGDPATDLKNEIVGTGKMLPSSPKCPGNGSYHFYGDGTDSSESSIIPDIGINYLRCSIADHIPSSLVGW